MGNSENKYPEWAMKCAARMTKTLNAKPRRKKTRDYIKSLPKIPGQRTVLPNEFLPIEINKKPIILTVHEKEEGKIRRTKRGDIRFGSRKELIRYCRPLGRINNVMSESVARVTRDFEVCRLHRVALYEAQNGKCGSCGGKLDDVIQASSLDHVIPKSLGGLDRLGNLLLMHGICNAKKTNDIPTGCELVALLAVNAKIGVLPIMFTDSV